MAIQLTPEEAQAQRDLHATQQMYDTLDWKPFDSSKPVTGNASALGQGVSRPLASVGRTAMQLGSVVPIFDDKLTSLLTGTDTSASQDWYFKNVVDDLGTDAVEYYTPDVASMSTTARVLNTAGNVVGSVPALIGAPEMFIADAGFSPATDLINQGVDAKAAMGVGAVNMAVNAAGMRLPAAFGTALSTRVATGAGSNLALGAAADATSAGILNVTGNKDQAAGYNIADPYARGLDALMGAAFGFHVGGGGATMPKPQREAVLVANNADSLERRTMPGVPVTPGADIKHQDALASAMRAVLAGEKVDISKLIKPEDFKLRPEVYPEAEVATSASAGFAPAVDQVMRDEGGYNVTEGDRGGETNFGISKRANPDVDVANLTREQASELYRDRYWTPINADALPADVQGVAFDAAVNQGVGWTKKALEESGGDRAKFLQLREERYKAIVAADPSQAKFLRGWLNRLGRYKETNPAGEALRERLVSNPEQLATDYAKLKDSEGGVVLNTDVARELSPEYLSDRTRSADVHEAASDTVKSMYEARLAKPTPEGKDNLVVLSAGGTGAGKTTGLQQANLGSPEIVYDTNANNLSSAVDKIELALASQRDVRVVYTFRDPVEALTQGALPRAERQAREFGSGRTVPLSEHAKTHVGSAETIRQLAEKYANNPRVEIIAVDNSRGKGQGRVVPLEELPRVEQNQLHESLRTALEQEHAAGKISDATRDGFLAKSSRPDAAGPVRQLDRGQPQPKDRQQEVSGSVSPTLQAAARIAADTPDLQVIDGFDADGAPRYRPMSEALAEIEAERAQAVLDAEAFPTAVNCALRRGS